MNHTLKQIDLAQWEKRYQQLTQEGLREAAYGGSLTRHAGAGDTRLEKLLFDPSPAALRLWNFLLSETQRLYSARHNGQNIIATMKDLGTVPIMAYALPNTLAFYPDGTWWIPCVMEQNTCDLKIACDLGIDESFCPVRAMLGAYSSYQHFPKPDLNICSVGATCDDFSAIAQRLNSLGHTVEWWEIPYRRAPDENEPAVTLPGGFAAPLSQVQFVTAELERIAKAISATTGQALRDENLRQSIRHANKIRTMLTQLRDIVFMARQSPLPALELLIAEMLAIHYCSDRGQTEEIYAELLSLVQQRIQNNEGFGPPDAARIFWVNPVADLRVMNLLEQAGGRLTGTEFLFCHALDPIPEDLPPLEALARTALADPMVGPTKDRAARIMRDAKRWNAEAIVIARIPGASHCPLEVAAIREMISSELPVLDIEVPPLSDSLLPALRTRLEALVETVRQRRVV